MLATSSFDCATAVTKMYLTLSTFLMRNIYNILVHFISNQFLSVRALCRIYSDLTPILLWIVPFLARSCVAVEGRERTNRKSWRLVSSGLPKSKMDPNPTAAYGNRTVSCIGAMHKWESFESRIKEACASKHNNLPTKFRNRLSVLVDRISAMRFHRLISTSYLHTSAWSQLRDNYTMDKQPQFYPHSPKQLLHVQYLRVDQK